MSTAMDDLKQALKSLAVPSRSKPRTDYSSVTSEWGVDWDDDMIARDLMQNFFDANREDVAAIAVQDLGTAVEVRAPVGFELERLFYLGSEKGPDDVGQYGEGFKAAAVCALRRYRGSFLLCGSGAKVVEIRIDTRPVADTQLHPLVYDWYVPRKEIPGTRLIIGGIPKGFARAMKTGLDHFFWDGNKTLGSELHNHAEAFRLYDSTKPDGAIFYRGLKRGVIPNLPICLVLDRQYKAIETKIAQDRDRNAFDHSLRDVFYKQCATSFISRGQDIERTIVERAQHLWTRGKGHPLLKEIASGWGHWPRSLAREVFGEQIFAKLPPIAPHGKTQQYEKAQRVQRRWHKRGWTALRSYFRSFGVRSALDVIDARERRAQQELEGRHHRPMTEAEMRGLGVLNRTVGACAPELANAFRKLRPHYSVGETEQVLGYLKQGRGYKSPEVYLAGSLFAGEFSEALAVFLHEHTHLYGHDGSRDFTDALTRVIESLICRRKLLDVEEAAWNEIREQVIRERADGSTDLEGRLKAMKKSELVALLKAVPPSLLRNTMNDAAGS